MLTVWGFFLPRRGSIQGIQSGGSIYAINRITLCEKSVLSRSWGVFKTMVINSLPWAHKFNREGTNLCCQVFIMTFSHPPPHTYGIDSY